jgi:hypothetical protein
MSVFLLVNNSSTVADTTPAAIFVEKGEAIRALYEYEKVSVFRPILLYDYPLKDGVALHPVCFYRVKRNNKGIVDGVETVPVNSAEFVKSHPFIFDKLESFLLPSNEGKRAV